MRSSHDARFCLCGQRLHYPTAPTQTYQLREIDRFGSSVPVPAASGAVFRVPRHFYILHGGFSPREIVALAARFGWRRFAYRHRALSWA